MNSKMLQKNMNKIFQNIAIFLFIFISFVIIHEISHILVASAFGEKLHILFDNGTIMVKGTRGYTQRLTDTKLSIIYISGPIVTSILFLISSIIYRKYQNRYTIIMIISSASEYIAEIVCTIFSMECDLPNAFNEKIYIGIIGFAVCGLIYAISVGITVKKVLSSLG